MPEFIDLSGKRFGMLTVMRRHETTNSHVYFECLCDCGKTAVVRNDKLTNGSKTNCGCQRKRRNDGTHYESRSKLYHVWVAMRQRCYNINSHEYSSYGGRGIVVCPEWLGHDGYIHFREWALSHGYDEKLGGKQCSIDRIDVNGNYCPENCRWISIQEQQTNTTRNIIVSANGESHTLKEWSRITGIRYSKLRKRIVELKWEARKALELEDE